MTEDFVCECCPYFIDGYCHNSTHIDCDRDSLEKENNPQPKEKNMTEVVLTFETQEQADCAVMALSKGYKVDQWFMSVSAGKPYCVRILVPSTSVTEISEE